MTSQSALLSAIHTTPEGAHDSSRDVSAHASNTAMTGTAPVRALDVSGTGLYRRVKRVTDIALSGLLLLLSAPLLLLIAVIVKLDSPGPALYVQRRVGKNGGVFRFYKFRSMLNNVDHTVAHRQFSKAYINGHGTVSSRSVDGTPPSAMECDGSRCADTVPDTGSPQDVDMLYKPPGNGSYVTRVGRWLRKYSLDELPQLVNVLKGDMSLVGPRPSMDCEVMEYSDWHRRRLQVVPGITGLAQINGRSKLAFDDIVRFDIHYIECRSLWMDLSILFRTIPVVLMARGAS